MKSKSVVCMREQFWISPKTALIFCLSLSKINKLIKKGLWLSSQQRKGLFLYCQCGAERNKHIFKDLCSCDSSGHTFKDQELIPESPLNYHGIRHPVRGFSIDRFLNPVRWFSKNSGEISICYSLSNFWVHHMLKRWDSQWGGYSAFKDWGLWVFFYFSLAFPLAPFTTTTPPWVKVA